MIPEPLVAILPGAARVASGGQEVAHAAMGMNVMRIDPERVLNGRAPAPVHP